MKTSLTSIASGDSYLQNPNNQFATSKSTSTSSSFSSIEPPSHERHHTKGVFSAQSSLGDLPPLGVPMGSSARSTLAPLKKASLSSSGKSLESNMAREKKSGGTHGIYNLIIGLLIYLYLRILFFPPAV